MRSGREEWRLAVRGKNRLATVADHGDTAMLPSELRPPIGVGAYQNGDEKCQSNTKQIDDDLCPPFIP